MALDKHALAQVCRIKGRGRGQGQAIETEGDHPWLAQSFAIQEINFVCAIATLMTVVETAVHRS
jgi:hypothetical protein